MTLPFEEMQALINAKRFMLELVLRTIPEKRGSIAELRQIALSTLRHYPAEHRIREVWRKNGK